MFTSPADDLALLGPVLDRVTPADCEAALRDAWAAPGRYVCVSGDAAVMGDAAAAVAAAYARSQAVAVRPTDAEASTAWAYSSFGAPGQVATRTHVDDLDFTEITFANGVRLNLKRTNFEANTIHVSCRLGTGQLTEPAAEPGLATFASLTYSAGGLGRHSTDDLQRILAGKTVGSSFSCAQDAFLVEGDTDGDNLALEFQLLAASIADPGFRPESLRVARKRIEAAYLSFEHTERGPLAIEVPRLCANGDPRFGLPARGEMMARSLDELRAWLAPQLSAGALEVTVVGISTRRRRSPRRRGRSARSPGAGRGPRSRTCAGSPFQPSRSRGTFPWTPRSQRALWPSTGRRPTGLTSTGPGGSPSLRRCCRTASG